MLKKNLKKKKKKLPMRKASRKVIFIKTSPPEDRVELLKPLNDLKDMEDDCEEIYTGGLLKRYSKRPIKFEHVTLADWAAWYDSCGKPYAKQSNELDTDNLPVETSLTNNDDDKESANKLPSKLKKRTKARIIRSCWFNKEKEPEKHYRELTMLFTPWRNEETDIIGVCSSYKERYMLLSNVISKQMEQYAVCNQDFNEMEQEMTSVEDSYDSIAPATQSVELQDEAEGSRYLHPDFNENYNFADDIGIPSIDSNSEPLILNELEDNEYRHLVQMLNLPCFTSYKNN